MEQHRTLVVFRRRAPLALALVIVGLLAAFLGTSRAARYQATVQLQVGAHPTDVDPTVELGQATLALTLAQELPSPSVVGQGVRATGADRSVGAVVDHTVATVVPGSSVIRLSVTDRSARTASELANAVATAFVADARRIGPLVAVPSGIIEAPRAVSSAPVTLVVPAVPPTASLGTDLRRNLAVGALVGLLAAALAVALVDFTGLTARTTDQVEERFGLPVLGVVPQCADRLAGGGTRRS